MIGTINGSDSAALFSGSGLVTYGRPICGQAASAKARQSPAAVNLWVQCSGARKADIEAGRYIADEGETNDPAFRVWLTEAGERAIARSASLRAQLATISNPTTARGFKMAQGVLAGTVAPGAVDWISGALSGDPTLRAGFLDGLNAPAGGDGGGIVQATRPSDSAGSEGGIPRPVLIGAGVVGVGVLALVALKLTKKKR